jgi:hypothetical protein
MNREPPVGLSVAHTLPRASRAVGNDAKSSQRWPVDKRPFTLCDGDQMRMKRSLPTPTSCRPIGVAPDATSARRPAAIGGV